MEAKIQAMGGRLVEGLTPRERDVLALLAQHLRYQDIAERLFMAISSVKWFAQQIYGKLGVDNRRDAIRRAQELGLLDAPTTAAITAKVEPVPEVTIPTGMVTFLFVRHEGGAGLLAMIEANAGQVFHADEETCQGAFRLASQALQAALNLAGQANLRVGLHTGPADLDSAGGYAASHTLARVAQIGAAGWGGQILLSGETASLLGHDLPAGVSLKDLGEHRLPGLTRAERLHQLIGPELAESYPPLPSAVTRPNNLPVQLTSFIGREAEMAKVARLLEKQRLVTLHGSGGTGKTRLAAETALSVLERYPGGVWLVELAAVLDPQNVAQAVAAALGLQPYGEITYQNLLLNYLRDKDLLLILDNCEHLLEACAALASELLRACPRLKLLATSREALGIAGESTYRVPSLSQSAAQDGQSEALRLFVERAEAARPGLELAASGRMAAEQICKRLDGIPLAIELAAARVNVMGVEQIAARLDERFRLLTGGSRTALPRQRTLRASIEWSYNLLAEGERLLLRRLSVFVGGWTLDAAEEVCGFDELAAWEVFDGLASLVSKSLVHMDPGEDGEGRYHMLETVRQFAGEMLAEREPRMQTCDRHLAYFAAWARKADQNLPSRAQKLWLDRIQAELDNLRAAMEWASAGDHAAGLGIAMALGWFFEIKTQLLEGRHWLSLFLDNPVAEYPLRQHGQALAMLAEFYKDIDLKLAWNFAHASIDLTQDKIDPPGWAYYTLAYVSYQKEDFQSTASFLKIAEQYAHKEQFILLSYSIKALFSFCYYSQGNLTEAGETIIQSLDLVEACGAISLIAECKILKARYYFELGKVQDAIRYSQEAMENFRSIGNKKPSSLVAFIAEFCGEYDLAVAESRNLIIQWRDLGSWRRVVYALRELAFVKFISGDDKEANENIDEAILIANSKFFDLSEQQVLLVGIGRAYISMLIWSGDYVKAQKWLDIQFSSKHFEHQVDYDVTTAELGIRLGRLGEAQLALVKALSESRINFLQPVLIYMDEICADLLHRQGHLERSARLLGAIEQRRQQGGMPRHPRFRPHYDGILARLREQLGAVEFERAYGAGQALEIGAACEEVLAFWGADPAPQAAPPA